MKITVLSGLYYVLGIRMAKPVLLRLSPETTVLACQSCSIQTFINSPATAIYIFMNNKMRQFFGKGKTIPLGQAGSSISLSSIKRRFALIEYMSLLAFLLKAIVNVNDNAVFGFYDSFNINTVSINIRLRPFASEQCALIAIEGSHVSGAFSFYLEGFLYLPLLYPLLFLLSVWAHFFILNSSEQCRNYSIFLDQFFQIRRISSLVFAARSNKTFPL